MVVTRFRLHHRSLRAVKTHPSNARILSGYQIASWIGYTPLMPVDNYCIQNTIRCYLRYQSIPTGARVSCNTRISSFLVSFQFTSCINAYSVIRDRCHRGSWTIGNALTWCTVLPVIARYSSDKCFWLIMLLPQ